MISDLFPRISVDTVRHFCHSRFTAMLLIALLLCSTIQPFSADNIEDTAEGSTNTMNSQTSQSSSSSSPPSSANSGSSRTDNGGSSGQSAGGSDPLETNAVKMYRRLFKQKRAAHLEAVGKMLQVGVYEKQFKMVKLILTKLFAVMSDARVKLMEAGYTPGNPFPVEEHVREVLSIVLENTVFLGEIALRLPDVVHALLRNSSEWQMAVHWSIHFSNDTKILVGSELELLNLMAQELEVVEKSPEFINPYREDTKLEALIDEEAENLLKEKLKEAKKKERNEKRKKRGPRLSTPHRDEL